MNKKGPKSLLASYSRSRDPGYYISSLDLKLKWLYLPNRKSYMENHRAYFVTVQFREDILQYSLLLGEEKNKNKKKGGGGGNEIRFDV